MIGNETQKTNISTGRVWLYYYDSANHLVKAEHKPSSGGCTPVTARAAMDFQSRNCARCDGPSEPDA